MLQSTRIVRGTMTPVGAFAAVAVRPAAEPGTVRR